MTAVLRDRKRLSSALSSLDGPSILKHLCRHEHERQITNDKMEEMKLSIEGDWLTVDEWESDYLRRVGETLNEAAVLFWTIDLAWRRYILDQETLAQTLDTNRIRSILGQYFTVPIEPYSVEDYHLEEGLGLVLDFGKMHESLVKTWTEKGRPAYWVERVASPIDTDVLVGMTKKYVKGVRRSSARIGALFDKYMSDDDEFSRGIPSHDSSPSQSRPDSPTRSSRSSRSPSNGPGNNGADGTSSRSSHYVNGSSATLAGTSRAQESEKKKGKRRREDSGDGERDREVSTAAQQEDSMDVDGAEQSQENILSAPRLPSSPSQPISPYELGFSPGKKTAIPPQESSAQVAGSTSNLAEGSTKTASTVQVVQGDDIDLLEASQFPQPLAKATYLTRISHSPAVPQISNRQRSDSPFGGTPRRSLPAVIRSMAVQTQSKLAKVRRSSEMHQEQERIKAESVERVMSAEKQQEEATGVDQGGEQIGDAAKRSKRQMEREKTEEIEEKAEEQEVQKRLLGSTPSGILMPPPPTARSSGEAGPPTSSGEEPSTVAEPSTILSSSPQLSSSSAEPPKPTGETVIPTSSSIEAEPSTQKSSPEFRSFPTAAQAGPPYESLAERLPPTSSYTTVNRTAYYSEVESQSQGDSQSQPTDSELPVQAPAPPVVSATTTVSRASSTSSSDHYPAILVPDTSVSTNADPSQPSSGESLNVPRDPNPTSLLSLVRTRTRSRSREASLNPNPPPSPILRRSSRLSKSPAPPEPVRPSPSKRASRSINLELPHVSSSDGNESQAFFTQAPINESQEFATQAQEMMPVEEEEDLPLSQASSDLTDLSQPVETTAAAKSDVAATVVKTIEDPLAELPAIVDEDFESFESQDKVRLSRKSFGDLENRATAGPPAEEALNLEDEDM